MPPSRYAFALKRFSASRENVEKVVNPPQTPVFQNSTAFWETCSSSAAIPTTNPIRIAPMRFVTNVSTGKEVFVGMTDRVSSKGAKRAAGCNKKKTHTFTPYTFSGAWP